MEIIAYVAWIVAIIGALIYMLSSNAKATELGRLMFACGLLVGLFGMSKVVLHLGS